MSAERTESKYVTVADDVQIHYWDAGEKDAPALVFIPGLTFSGEVFKHQLEHFKADHRVMLVDPRGQGLSTKCPFGNDYHTHGADLIRLVEAEGIEKPTLIGWSCGNLEVWSYLEQAGMDAASGAVTVDMSPLPHSENPADWTEGTPEELSEIMTHVLVDPEAARGFWDEYLREVMWQGPLDPDLYDYFMDMGARTPYWVTHELFGDAILSDYRAVAQEAARTIPTLMFIAEHWADVAEPFYNRLCPETPTYVMGGHLMAIQYHERFNARLEQFLKTGK
jgi:non-heme chloroperoxidase